MAVIMGQAMRRRAGQAPNTLVMAQEGNLSGERDLSEPCPVGRCTFVDPFGDPQAMDFHLLAKHPRHALGREAAHRIG